MANPTLFSKGRRMNYDNMALEVDQLVVNGSVVAAAQGANIPALGGTLTGTTDGDMADVADIALSTTDTYTDAAVNTAVNTAIASVNLQLKELQTKVNAIITALENFGVTADS